MRYTIPQGILAADAVRHRGVHAEDPGSGSPPVLRHASRGRNVKPRGYRLLPHTADIRLEVRGQDIPALFAESVAALFSLITDRRRVRAAETRILEASGEDLPDTLYLLLRGALLLFTADHFIVRSARGTMDASGARVEVSGEPFDGARHAAVREIKAVTAHQLSVERIPGGVVARFVVDV
ncbi:MAG: hypothetical protein C3F14_02885 [Deltaproteobacteria bacterium]|nr:MAG: hypothetical protein C3F14_02885 [Deltaproteobacteria bacterium]